MSFMPFNSGSRKPSRSLCSDGSLVESLWFESQIGGSRRECASGKICKEDRKEIYHWSAGYSDLLGGLRAFNLSFHPLPSGRFCLSRTFYASDFSSALKDVRPNKALSSDSSYRLYTHAWVIPNQTLRYFGNHALALYRALQREEIGVTVNSGGVIAGQTPSACETVRCMIRTLASRSKSRLPSGEWEAMLESSGSLLVFGQSNLLPWFNRQLSVMSMRQREEISFCTSLRFSSRRPFQITGIGKSGRELRRAEKKFDLPVWDIRQNQTNSNPAEIKPFMDPELIQLWECLKECFWGDSSKYHQGVQLWNQYRQRHGASVDQARETLLEWSIDAYDGLEKMQMKHTQQVYAMVDMLDALLTN